MKQKKKGIIFAIALLIAIICVISVLSIAIKIANRNGQEIADIEAKTEEILSAETTTNPSWEFNATGAEQTFIVPKTGTYTFEILGASGAKGKAKFGGGETDFHDTNPGAGTKVTGKINLTEGTTLYLYVGKKGENKTGGWNGGGDGLGYGSTSTEHPNGKYNPMDWVEYGGNIYRHSEPPGGYSGAGGGASDIRLGGKSLSDRIIVAPGGPGGGFSVYVSWNQGSQTVGKGGHNRGYANVEKGNRNSRTGK